MMLKRAAWHNRTLPADFIDEVNIPAWPVKLRMHRGVLFERINIMPVNLLVRNAISQCRIHKSTMPLRLLLFQHLQLLYKFVPL